jgi:hypothetical protein
MLNERIPLFESTPANGCASYCPSFKYQGFQVCISRFPQCFSISLEIPNAVYLTFYWSPKTGEVDLFNQLEEAHKNRTFCTDPTYPEQDLLQVQQILDKVIFPQIHIDYWLRILEAVKEEAYREGQCSIRKELRALLGIY